MRTNAVLCSILIAMLIACDEVGPVPPLSHSAAMHGCGPADGPATIVFLADEPVQSSVAPLPNATIYIGDSVDRIAGRTFDVTGDSAAASYTVNGNEYEPASAGTVTVTSVSADSTVHGSVSLHFSSRIVETQFTAPWLSSGWTCP